MNATERLRDAFTAELLTETKVIDHSLPEAIKVEHADFSWDGVPPDFEVDKKANRRSKNALGAAEQAQKAGLAAEHTFKVKDINLTIPRGQLCAIVGPVGSGKSSLLQGMIGEMRREAGTVQFGGSVGYCQQSAWIQVRHDAPCQELRELISKYRMRQFERTSVSDVPSKRSA
jgi:ABC-type polysaccharide/polyol phosphate transport system ATPase subunit